MELWVEKYRPQTLEEYVGNETIKNKIADYLKQGSIQNLLFHGVAGTGKTTLAKLIEKNQLVCEGDETIGAEILLNAIEKPFIQILKNAGIDKYHAILAAVEHDFKGYNIKSESYVDMIEEGIIDPTKVTRTALENAVSVAGTMLITECTIVDSPEDEPIAVKMPGM